MTLKFDEEYYTTEGYDNYKNYPHFEQRAIFIRDILKPLKGVINFGGGLGYTNKYLTYYGIPNINWEISAYCIENKDMATTIITDDTKINFDDYDWLVSWNVLDCLNDTNITETLKLLNGFKGKQLHIICCDGHDGSENYKKQGYFIKSHDYWKAALPTVCLICYDCRKIIQLPIGYTKITKVPLCWGLVTE